MKTALILLVALCAAALLSYKHQNGIAKERISIVRQHYPDAIAISGVPGNGYTEERAMISSPTDFSISRNDKPSIRVRVDGKKVSVIDDGS